MSGSDHHCFETYLPSGRKRLKKSKEIQDFWHGRALKVLALLSKTENFQSMATLSRFHAFTLSRFIIGFALLP